VINQIRGFLIERDITVRQGAAPLRRVLPDILSSNTGVLSPRMVDPQVRGASVRAAAERAKEARKEGVGVEQADARLPGTSAAFADIG
jgi:hypothetical protein